MGAPLFPSQGDLRRRPSAAVVAAAVVAAAVVAAVVAAVAAAVVSVGGDCGCFSVPPSAPERSAAVRELFLLSVCLPR